MKRNECMEYSMTVNVLAVLIIVNLGNHVQGQCRQEQMTFEKLSGTTITSKVEVKMRGRSGSSGVTLTEDCLKECRNDPYCVNFEIDYDTQECRHVTADDARKNRLNEAPVTGKTAKAVNSATLINMGRKSSVFNKICLKARKCSKSWSFERVPNHILFGYVDKNYKDVASVHKCQELCLNETSFKCQSGVYDYIGRRCQLSSESRRSKPASFRPASTTSIDYFENQCIEDESGCQYEHKNDVDLGYADVMKEVKTELGCKGECDNHGLFKCRSFTYYAETKKCLLSSEDTISAGIRTLVRTSGAKYFEKTNCLNLKLLCTTEAMIVTLHSTEPFKGRIYAKTIPGDCEVSGSGNDVTKLAMPLVATSTDSLCGIVAEGDGRYSNTIVVQHHPLIQRRGDREVRLLCLFESSSKTVSNSYSVVSTGLRGSATATVNATAPSPSIRLRITDKRGRDIKGTKLGTEIYIRIEIDDNSAFGIFARDLKAHSGSKGDSLSLLDEKGCPSDLSIFPGLDKVKNSKNLIGKFEAFKFSEDVVVRFTLNVQFCITECLPTDCGSGIQSYGKKRRKRQYQDPLNFGNGKILPDYPLAGEITVEGTTVRQVTDSDEEDENRKHLEGKVCISQAILIVSAATLFALIMCILCSCAVCLMLNRRKRVKMEQPKSEYSLRLGSVFTNDRLTPIHEDED